jgi:hypothetical protein
VGEFDADVLAGYDELGDDVGEVAKISYLYRTIRALYEWSLVN